MVHKDNISITSNLQVCLNGKAQGYAGGEHYYDLLKAMVCLFFHILFISIYYSIIYSICTNPIIIMENWKNVTLWSPKIVAVAVSDTL